MALKYILAADAIKAEIIHLAEQGIQQLPTEMEMMRKYQVSRQTIRRAMSVLQSEGLITRRQGSGSYINGAALSDLSPRRTVAILAPFVNDYTFSSSLRDVQPVFSEAGYQSQLFFTKNMVGQERQILQSLLEHPVRGILVQGTKNAFPNPNIDLYGQLQDRGVCILFLGASYAGLTSVPCLTTDDYSGGYLLARHLIRHNHTRIAGIFRSDDISGHQRYLGCVCALRDSGLPVEDQHFFWYERAMSDTMPGLLNAPRLRFLLRMYLPECTAVICQDDELAVFLIHQLGNYNIQVPQQMSVVAFGSSYRSRSLPWQITAAIPDNTNLWAHASKVLLRLMEKQSISDLPFSWMLQKNGSDISLPR